MIPELGKRLTPPKVAKLLEMDAAKVRKHYKELGGFLLGERIYFYEEHVKNAIQDKIKRPVDGTGDNRGQEGQPSQVQNEKRSNRMGAGGKKKAAATRVGAADPHGVLA